MDAGSSSFDNLDKYYNYTENLKKTKNEPGSSSSSGVPKKKHIIKEIGNLLNGIAEGTVTNVTQDHIRKVDKILDNLKGSYEYKMQKFTDSNKIKKFFQINKGSNIKASIGTIKNLMEAVKDIKLNSVADKIK